MIVGFLPNFIRPLKNYENTLRASQSRVNMRFRAVTANHFIDTEELCKSQTNDFLKHNFESDQQFWELSSPFLFRKMSHSS